MAAWKITSRQECGAAGGKWIGREGGVGVVGVVEVPPPLSASVDIHQQRAKKLKSTHKEKK